MNKLCKPIMLQNLKPLTVHRNVKGRTRLPSTRSGSANVNVFPPSTGLETLPKEQGPEEVTLLWYSLRQSRNIVLQDTGQGTDGSGRCKPPQQSPEASSPRWFAISRIWSSKNPDPRAHCRQRKKGSEFISQGIGYVYKKRQKKKKMSKYLPNRIGFEVGNL